MKSTEEVWLLAFRRNALSEKRPGTFVVSVTNSAVNDEDNFNGTRSPIGSSTCTVTTAGGNRIALGGWNGNTFKLAVLVVALLVTAAVSLTTSTVNRQFDPVASHPMTGHWLRAAHGVHSGDWAAGFPNQLSPGAAFNPVAEVYKWHRVGYALPTVV